MHLRSRPAGPIDDSRTKRVRTRGAEESASLSEYEDEDSEPFFFEKDAMAIKEDDLQSVIEQFGPYAFHNTHPKNVPSILEKGLIPPTVDDGIERQKSRYWHTGPEAKIPRRENHVYFHTGPSCWDYLTAKRGDYKFYEGHMPHPLNRHPCPIRIDMRKLDPSKFNIDEAGEKLESEDDRSEDVLSSMVNNFAFSYRGAIPPEAIEINPDLKQCPRCSWDENMDDGLDPDCDWCKGTTQPISLRRYAPIRQYLKDKQQKNSARKPLTLYRGVLVDIDKEKPDSIQWNRAGMHWTTDLDVAKDFGNLVYEAQVDPEHVMGWDEAVARTVIGDEAVDAGDWPCGNCLADSHLESLSKNKWVTKSQHIPPSTIEIQLASGETVKMHDYGYSCLGGYTPLTNDNNGASGICEGCHSGWGEHVRANWQDYDFAGLGPDGGFEYEKEVPVRNNAPMNLVAVHVVKPTTEKDWSGGLGNFLKGIQNPKREYERTEYQRQMTARVDPNFLASWIEKNGPYMYHGARVIPEIHGDMSIEDVVKQIQQEGIKPNLRGKPSKFPTPSEYADDSGWNRDSDEWWHHTRPNHVYMTPDVRDAYGPHVFRIDLRKLNPDSINPDEDVWRDHGWQGQWPFGTHDYLQDSALQPKTLGEQAEESGWGDDPDQTQFGFERMDYHGIAHRGTIPPEAIEYMQASKTASGKPQAIICDLDGTLASVDHRRYLVDDTCKSCMPEDDFYKQTKPDKDCPTCDGSGIDPELKSKKRENWEAFHERSSIDSPVPEVVDILRGAFNKGQNIIFSTGRPDIYRYQTQWWLAENLPWLDEYELMMRKSKPHRKCMGAGCDNCERGFVADQRPDDVVKEEMYRESIEPNFDVQFAVDDRPSVIAKWKELGLPVIERQDPKIPPLVKTASPMSPKFFDELIDSGQRYLYHNPASAGLNTDYSHELANKILKEGLIPQGDGFNYQGDIKTREGFVYLYDPAKKHIRQGHPLIRIDISKLDPSLFHPDEDFLIEDYQRFREFMKPVEPSKPEDFIQHLKDAHAWNDKDFEHKQIPALPGWHSGEHGSSRFLERPNTRDHGHEYTDTIEEVVSLPEYYESRGTPSGPRATRTSLLRDGSIAYKGIIPPEALSWNPAYKQFDKTPKDCSGEAECPVCEVEPQQKTASPMRQDLYKQLLETHPYLYHNPPNHEIARLILRDGLKPKDDQELVFLSRRNDDTYAGHLGHPLVQVDVSKINPNNLFADSDFISDYQIFDFPESGSESDYLTKHKEEDHDNDLASLSLKNYGSIAHRGLIPPDALSWNPKYKKLDTTPTECSGRDEYCPACEVETPEQKTAAWADVRNKARRIRRSGGVEIIRLEDDVIIARVQGDHRDYDVEIFRQYPSAKSVTFWTCSCKWGEWAFKRQVTYVGRFCSHALATLYEAHSQEYRKKKITSSDKQAAESVMTKFAKEKKDYDAWRYQDYPRNQYMTPAYNWQDWKKEYEFDPVIDERVRQTLDKLTEEYPITKSWFKGHDYGNIDLKQGGAFGCILGDGTIFLNKNEVFNPNSTIHKDLTYKTDKPWSIGHGIEQLTAHEFAHVLHMAITKDALGELPEWDLDNMLNDSYLPIVRPYVNHEDNPVKQITDEAKENNPKAFVSTYAQRDELENFAEAMLDHWTSLEPEPYSREIGTKIDEKYHRSAGKTAGWTRKIVFNGRRGPVFLDAEVADTPSAIQTGLMYRSFLPMNQGMLFDFKRPTTTGFWMQNVSIPLSIAFIDNLNRIIDIKDMDICFAGMCPSYAPDKPFTMAIEVNQGWFKYNGVDVGDFVNIT